MNGDLRSFFRFFFFFSFFRFFSSFLCVFDTSCLRRNFEVELRTMTCVKTSALTRSREYLSDRFEVQSERRELLYSVGCPLFFSVC